MKIFRSLDDLPDQFRGGALAIGNFDGVHLGHARIAERLVAKARQVGGPAWVFTFDPLPAQVLRPESAPPPLSLIDRKAELLAELGVEALVAYPADLAFLRLGPEEFFHRFVRAGLQARAVVEGANFRFGRNRQGDIHLLRRLCAQAGIELEVIEPVELGGQVVSSSRLRALLMQGEVQQALEELTRPYRLRGRVIRGAGRGTQLGYPTANLADVATLLPAEGIYAGRAWADGSSWPAAISLGPNPTFDEGTLKLEAHLIGYRGTLYDRPVELDFLARLRDVRRFPSASELLNQMRQDVAAARAIATELLYGAVLTRSDGPSTRTVNGPDLPATPNRG
ncbi:MAG: bifunctional riboflavin kinase/FAD synthetase [Thermoguttaceae bacterium]